jgi:hypothetical protein
MISRYETRTLGLLVRHYVGWLAGHGLRRFVGAQLVVLSLLFPLATNAAIARDSFASIGASGGSITLVGSDTIVIVGVNCGVTTACTVTVGGVTATFIGESEHTGAGGEFNQDFWAHITSSGSKTVTTSSGGGLAAIAYTGADPTSPIAQHTGNINVSSLTLSGILSTSWLVAGWNRSGANVNLGAGPITCIAGSCGGLGMGDSGATVSSPQTQNWDSPTNTGMWMLELQAPAAAALQRSVISLIKAYWIF